MLHLYHCCPSIVSLIPHVSLPVVPSEYRIDVVQKSLRAITLACKAVGIVGTHLASTSAVSALLVTR